MTGTAAGVVCLHCGCPADLGDPATMLDRPPWECPNCGRGFVVLALGDDDSPPTGA